MEIKRAKCCLIKFMRSWVHSFDPRSSGDNFATDLVYVEYRYTNILICLSVIQQRLSLLTILFTDSEVNISIIVTIETLQLIYLPAHLNSAGMFTKPVSRTKLDFKGYWNYLFSKFFSSNCTSMSKIRVYFMYEFLWLIKLLQIKWGCWT